MKKTCLQLLMLMASFALFSCGGSDSDSDSPAPAPAVSLKLVSQSIAEGAQVDAATTTSITLNYNNPVRVSGNGITLNNVAVSAKTSSNTSVDIPLALEAGKSYTLKVARGAIVYSSDGKVVAPEFTLNFTTKGNEPAPIDENAPIAKKMGWGWNLGNHFDTSGDAIKKGWGYWDGVKNLTSSLFQKLAAAGARTVRLPATWTDHMDKNYTISADYLNEVAGAVDLAIASGLIVILNTHHDSFETDLGNAATNEETYKKDSTIIVKLWEQVATKFASYSDKLIFETFNEVHTGDNWSEGSAAEYALLNKWNQWAVNTIRKTGGNNATRWIGIPAYAASSWLALQTSFVLPTDDAKRLMVSVHFYDPTNFTLSPEDTWGKSEWGHTAAAGKYATDSNEDHVVDIFKRLHDKFIAKNIPVYIGEYGCVMHKPARSNLFRNYYLEYVCRAAHEYGMPLCIWDNNATGGGNEHHGYFSHTDGTYLNGLENLVKRMIDAATSDDATYTLESIYNRAPN